MYPSHFGESVGRWEGDTLGITAAVLGPGVTLTIKAHPHKTENAEELLEVVSADGKTLNLGLGGRQELQRSRTAIG